MASQELSHRAKFRSMSLDAIVSCTFLIICVLLYNLFRAREGRNLRRVRRHRPLESHVSSASGKYSKQNVAGIRSRCQELIPEQDKQTKLYKELYFKIHNLEDYPEILGPAQGILENLLAQALSYEKSQQFRPSILSIDVYKQAALEVFLASEHHSTANEYVRYVQRKTSGQPDEWFRTREEAKRWLIQQAPVRYVDGAWLGHIHKITTPFALRGVTKGAWQILSEELGDGDLKKNHVYVYRELLKSIAIDLPDANSIDFIQAGLGMDDCSVWRAAVSQLLISVFPNEYLPEILGFNMHFEQLTLETLKAAKELPSFGISGYYFHLHISIDNADTGHTAMALNIVIAYLDLIFKTEGEAVVQEKWKRIQAGYSLSKNSSEPIEPNRKEAQVIKIFGNKAKVSQMLHCTSKVRIGKHTLADWLSPNSWNNLGCQLELLDSLANTSPWIRRGDSSKSLLVRELSWPGKMFGAFTHAEVENLKTWIDSLKDASHRETSNIDANIVLRAKQDLAVDHPVFLPQNLHTEMPQTNHSASQKSLKVFTLWSALPAGNIMPSNLLPLWFAHCCLLENAINTPFKTSTPLYSHVVRLLRAEYGFTPETSGVEGGISNNGYSPSLVDLGCEIARRHRLPPPTCLKDILKDRNTEKNRQSVEFAYLMLGWAMRPGKNLPFLLGTARAFLDLEAWVASDSELLDAKDRVALERIIKRKLACFEMCFLEISKDGIALDKFITGYELGHLEIRKLMDRDAQPR